MRALFASLLLLVFSANASFAESHGSIKGVMMYADWCASCKILDPKIQALESDLKDAGVHVARLNYTEKDKEALLSQAAALHVEDAIRIWTQNKVKTGQFLLIDTNADRVVGVVTKTFSDKEILAAARSAAAGAKGL